jgi:putative Holliday junction resolvase
MILAFDYGVRHIGVATGNRITGTATPLVELLAHKGEPHWAEIETLLNEWQPDLCLIGLPLNMDDTESPMSQRSREFAQELSTRFGVTTLMVDERLTTFEAIGREGADIHALSAQIIAETYLSDSNSASSDTE